MNWQIPVYGVTSFEEYRLLTKGEKAQIALRFSLQFKRAKKACKLSYRALAERLGCEYTAPAQWARARWIPQTHNLRQLAEICGVDQAWFFGTEPHPNESGSKPKRERFRLVSPSKNSLCENPVGTRSENTRESDPVPEVREPCPNRTRRDLSEW